VGERREKVGREEREAEGRKGPERTKMKEDGGGRRRVNGGKGEEMRICREGGGQCGGAVGVDKGRAGRMREGKVGWQRGGVVRGLREEMRKNWRGRRGCVRGGQGRGRGQG